MSLWQKYEDLVLEFMESRVSELLDQGDVTSPKVIANVRETAAWVRHWQGQDFTLAIEGLVEEPCLFFAGGHRIPLSCGN